MKIWSTVILFLISIMFVFACDCEFSSNIDQEINSSTFIAIGDVEGSSELYYIFKPVKIYKSHKTEHKQFKIMFERILDCSYPLKPNKKYLIYGQQKGDSIRTYLCSRTSQIENTIDEYYLDNWINKRSTSLDSNFQTYVTRKLKIKDFNIQSIDKLVGSPSMKYELNLDPNEPINYDHIFDIHPAILNVKYYELELESNDNSKTIKILLFDTLEVEYSNEEIIRMIKL